MREIWHWILKIVQHLHKWLINISEVVNARNVTLNPEICPRFAKMAYQFKWSTECEKCDIESWKLSTFAKMPYQYKWSTECEKCDIESWKLSNIWKNGLSGLINLNEVLNVRNVTLNPVNCLPFGKMAYQYNWSTEIEKCDIESWKLSNICTNGLSI